MVKRIMASFTVMLLMVFMFSVWGVGVASAHSFSSTSKSQSPITAIQRSPSVHVDDVSGCVQAGESDDGFTITGSVVYLENIYFGVDSVCSNTAYNISWSVTSFAECSTGPSSSPQSDSGFISRLAPGGYDDIYDGGLVGMYCQSGVLPTWATVTFTVKATLTGGNNSLSTSVANYNT